MSFFDPRTPGEWFRDTINRFSGADAPLPERDVYRLELREQADLTQVAAMTRGPERRAAAWRELQAVAQRTQPEMRERLDEWKREGLVQAWEGHALVNAIDVVVPTSRRSEFLDLVEGLPQMGDVVTVVEGDDGVPDEPEPPAVPRPPSTAPDGPPVEPSRPVAVPGTADFEDGVSWGNRQIRADEAWKQGIDGRGVVVGLLDSGIDADHPAFTRALDPDLARSTAPGTDLDDPGLHGTHTAGTVAGSMPGYSFGAAPGAQVRMASMQFGAHAGGLDSDFLGLMEWMLAPGDGDAVFGTRDAAKGVDVLSNSWGSGPGTAAEEGGDGYSRAITHLDRAGIVQVFAAGNDGRAGDGTLSQPSDRPEVLSVAATDRQGRIADFSSRGSNPRAAKSGPDIAAPGEGVPSSLPIGLVDTNMILSRALAKVGVVQGYGPVDGTKGSLWNVSGTSMAAPHVAGVVALLLQAHPTLTPAQAREAVTSSATDIEQPGVDTVAGAGLIDVPSALAAAARMVDGAAPGN